MAFSPQQKAKRRQEIKEQMAAQKVMIEEVKSLNPFEFYEPSTGTISPEGIQLLNDYIKPEDIPQHFDSQLDAHLSNAAINGAFGGNQSGKTLAGAIEAFIWTTGEVPLSMKDIYPKEKIPTTFPQHIRVETVDYNTLSKIVLPTYQEWCPKEYIQGGWGKNYSSEHRLLKLGKKGQLRGTIDFMCLRPDQRILMADGREIPIDLVQIGDFVCCNEGTTQVVNKFESKCPEYYCIKTIKGNEIVCSSRHPFLTECGWKQAQQLTLQDVMIEPDIAIDYLDNELLDDWQLIVLGILIGDGYITQWSVRWTCWSQVLIEWVKECLPNNLKVSPVKNVPHEYYITQTTKRNYSPVMKLMKDSGLIGRTSHDKFVPDIIFQQSKEKIGLFLKALFSTDGTFSGHQITYSTRSFRLAEDVKKLLHRININATVLSYYLLSEFDGYDCSGTQYLVIFGSRKDILTFNKFAGFVGKSKDWKTFANGFYEKRDRCKNGYKNKIKSIKEIQGGRCVDIEVNSQNHNYIVDGMVVHNTNKQDAESHQGPPRHGMIYDEEPRYDIYKENLMRFVTADRLKIYFGMTPTKGMSWIYEDIFMKSEDGYGNNVNCFNIASVTNKKANLLILREILDGQGTYDEIKMRLLGLFVSLSGFVYGALFNKSIHLIPPFDLLTDNKMDNYTIYRGLDPHLTTPTACIEIAIDREGFEYVVGCYTGNGDTEEIKEDLAQRAKERKYRLGWTACDKSADSTIKILGDRNIFLELSRGKNAIPAMFPSEKFTGSAHAGVNEIKKLLKIDPIVNKPKLFIFDIPENKPLITAMRTLERDRARDEEAKGERDKINDQKYHTHACLRYCHQRRMQWMPPVEDVPEYEYVSERTGY